MRCLRRRPREWGLADALVPDEELFDTAVAWAKKLAGQAPLAVEQIKQVSNKADLDEGIEAEKQGFATAFLSEDGKEGISAFLQKRSREVAGQVAHRSRPIQPARGADPRVDRCTVALTGAGISVPSGIPDFRTPGEGIWEKVDPMEVAHIDAFRRDPARFWGFYRQRLQMLGDMEPNGAHEALAELERRGRLEAVITQNIDTLHTKAGSERVIEVHGSIRTASCQSCGESFELAEVESLFGEDAAPRSAQAAAAT